LTHRVTENTRPHSLVFFPSDNPKYYRNRGFVYYKQNKSKLLRGFDGQLPVFKQISDRIFANNPQWSSPVNGKGRVTASKPLILSGKRDETEKLLAALPAEKPHGSVSGEWLSVEKDTLNRTVIKNYTNIKDSVPNVLNMGLRDALYILENKGYRVKFSGKGRIVRQNPASGSALEKHGIIEIELSEEYETE